MDPRIRSYCLAGFLMDLVFYIVWTALPFKALALGADAITLGILPAFPSVVYILVCLAGSRLNDQPRKIPLGLYGCMALACGCLLEERAGTLGEMLWATLPIGIGAALFWPAVQARIGRLSRPDELEANLGWFNLLWSAGKGIGFLVGGLLVDLDAGAALALSAVLSAFLGVRLPRDASSPAPTTSAPAVVEDPGAWVKFMKAAWLANFAAWGIGATLGSLYPKLVEDLPHKAQHFGTFLGLLNLSQTVAFAWFGRTRGWIRSPAHLFAWEAAALACVCAVPWLGGSYAAFALAPVLGGMMGLCYSSSLYYSLRAGVKKEGRATGFHEAILSSGNILVPFVGGAIATLSGALPAPFLLAGGVLAVVMVSQWRGLRATAPQPAVKPAVD